MNTVTLVTTFHKAGMEKYGQNFIKSFEKYSDLPLLVYAEDCNPVVTKHNIKVLNQKQTLPKLNAFKERWHNVPKANGICPPEIKAKRPKDWHKEFKWDAIRFANKVYAVFDAAQQCNTDWIVWIDADMIIHNNFSINEIQEFIPSKHWLSYLGRERKWPECGFYGINIKHQTGIDFLSEFERVYEEADTGIFKMEEWHDSYVFYEVLKKFPQAGVYNISEGLVVGEGHPLINSNLGKYMDHLKGGRKDLGKSKKTDLLVNRKETYWSIS